MTIFEFIRSRGWEPLLNGRWSKPGSHPMSNTLTVEEVLARLLREDTVNVEQPDPVEEKIDKLCNEQWGTFATNDMNRQSAWRSLKQKLIELVALAREKK